MCQKWFATQRTPKKNAPPHTNEKDSKREVLCCPCRQRSVDTFTRLGLQGFCSKFGLTQATLISIVSSAGVVWQLKTMKLPNLPQLNKNKLKWYYFHDSFQHMKHSKNLTCFTIALKQPCAQNSEPSSHSQKIQETRYRKIWKIRFRINVGSLGTNCSPPTAWTLPGNRQSFEWKCHLPG